MLCQLFKHYFLKWNWIAMWKLTRKLIPGSNDTEIRKAKVWRQCGRMAIWPQGWKDFSQTKCKSIDHKERQCILKLRSWAHSEDPIENENGCICDYQELKDKQHRRKSKKDYIEEETHGQ